MVNYPCANAVGANPCVCVCVCADLSPRSVCIWKGGVNPCLLCVYMHVCVCVCVCVCMCVCVWLFNHQGLLAYESKGYFANDLVL